MDFLPLSHRPYKPASGSMDARRVQSSVNATTVKRGRNEGIYAPSKENRSPSLLDEPNKLSKRGAIWI